MPRWPSNRKEAAFMTGRSRFLLAALAAPILALQPLAYQGPATNTRISSTSKGAQDLARGWLALVNGQPGDAERSSDALLKASPRDHDALSLKIRARLGGRGVPAALDAYEAWLPAVRQREDVFLLETIATGLVETLTSSKDTTIRARALELLAAIGHADAAAQLRTMAGTGATAQGDAALARLGDAAAVKRLATRVRDGGARDVSDAIDALSEGGVKTAAPTIAAALDPSRPLPTKMAAARALGRSGRSHARAAAQAGAEGSGPAGSRDGCSRARATWRRLVCRADANVRQQPGWRSASHRRRRERTRRPDWPMGGSRHRSPQRPGSSRQAQGC